MDATSTRPRRTRRHRSAHRRRGAGPFAAGVVTGVRIAPIPAPAFPFEPVEVLHSPLSTHIRYRRT